MSEPEAPDVEQTPGPSFLGKVFSGTNPLLGGILIGSGLLLAVLFIFWLGMVVGERKADFTHRVGEQFGREFGGRVAPPPVGRPHIFPAPGKGFFGGHGTAGEVVKAEDGQLVIVGPENVEKTVIVSENTVLIKGRERVQPREIEVGNRVVVIGTPNNEGQIN